MKIKANTMLEKMGFKDTDLGSPKHDELIAWIFNNALGICKSVIKDAEVLGIKKIYLETPVTKNNGYIIGYTDVEIRASVNVTRKAFIERERSAETNWVWADVEYPEITYRDTIHIIIEAKPSVPSIGEVLRQFNTYKTVFNSKNNIWVLVAPPSPYTALLENEGIVCVFPNLETETYK
jgi:hypothetical protein